MPAACVVKSGGIAFRKLLILPSNLRDKSLALLLQSVNSINEHAGQPCYSLETHRALVLYITGHFNFLE